MNQETLNTSTNSHKRILITPSQLSYLWPYLILVSYRTAVRKQSEFVFPYNAFMLVVA